MDTQIKITIYKNISGIGQTSKSIMLLNKNLKFVLQVLNQACGFQAVIQYMKIPEQQQNPRDPKLILTGF